MTLRQRCTFCIEKLGRRFSWGGPSKIAGNGTKQRAPCMAACLRERFWMKLLDREVVAERAHRAARSNQNTTIAQPGVTGAPSVAALARVRSSALRIAKIGRA